MAMGMMEILGHHDYTSRESVWHCVNVWKDPVACCNNVA